MCAKKQLETDKLTLGEIERLLAPPVSRSSTWYGPWSLPQSGWCVRDRDHG